jgi:hypothetical protein
MTLWPSWLRRRPAKPLDFVRTGSNPVGVAFMRYIYAQINKINKKNIYFIYIKYVPVAQRIRRETTNLKIAGSNPAGNAFMPH